MCAPVACVRLRVSDVPPRYKVAHCALRVWDDAVICVFVPGDVAAGWQKQRKQGEQLGSWKLWESEWEVEPTTGCQVWFGMCPFN